MEEINTFLNSAIINEYCTAVLRILEGKLLLTGFEDVREKIQEIGVKTVICEYFEEIIFGGNDGELYALQLI